MRKFALALAAVSFIGVNGVAAADLSYKGSLKDEPYEAPVAPIWGGLYVGGHIGGLWTKDDHDSAFWRKCRKSYDSAPAAEIASVVTKKCYDWKEIKNAKFSDDDNDTSFLGGVHIGYNWQEDARVLGVEADVSFADGVDYLASIRARLGYAMDALLIYATAGVAFANFDDDNVHAKIFNHNLSFDAGGDSDVGLVVGGGVEYKLATNWSVGVEGLYYFFGDNTDSKIFDFGCFQKKLVHEDDNDLFVVRGRLSYHFSDERYDAPLK